MKTTRRNFLKTGSTAAAGIAAATALPVAAAEPKSQVYVAKGKAETAIPALMARLGGMEKFVKPGSRVLIKPNMSMANPPDWATTTSPEAVRAVAQLCLAAGARRVVLCDNTFREADLCKSKSGIADAVADLKGVVVFVPKGDALFEEKADGRATNLKKTKIVKELLRADTFINLPVAKSHSAAGVSLGIKGLMGLVKDRWAMHSEMDLHTAIAELLYYMKPDLTIVDAGRALLDNGPGGPGKVAELNLYIGGTDPVAVDSVAVTKAAWYGKTFEGKQVKHLQVASDLGFGNIAADRIDEIMV